MSANWRGGRIMMNGPNKGEIVERPMDPGEVLRAKFVAGKKKQFLIAFRLHGTMGKACQEAHTTREKVKEWMQEDAEFAKGYEDALESFVDCAEEELFKRGVQGVKEPVFYKGVRVDYIVKKSDTCLIFYLKGRRNAVFGDKTALTGADGGPLQMQLVERLQAGRRRVQELPPEPQKQLASLTPIDAEISE